MAAGKRTTSGQEIADMVRSGQLAPEEAAAAVAQMVGTAIGQTDPAQPMGIDLIEEGEDQLEDVFAEQERAEQAERAEEARRNRINALGHRLKTLANEQVTLRQQTEERWLQDIRQFNGQYDPNTFPVDESGEQVYGSRLFVPLTRRLCGLVEARLYDVIFQAGERNFVMKPTPVPELDQAQQLADKMHPDASVALPNGQKVAVGAVAGAVRELVEEAQRRADGMQREIDDQLAECKYPTHARNAIHDAVLLGTGILKGPTILWRTAKRWKYDAESQTYALKMERRPVPVTVRVDPWNFLPDMSATTIEEAEFVFERHFMTRRELSALKDMDAVDQDALRLIIEREPQAVASYRSRLREINGAEGAPDKRYEVWEYHGPLSAEDLDDCGCLDYEHPETGEMCKVELDPLTQYTGIVWFCEGTVFKASLNPLDSGELPYRVFTWQKDESNIFGFGLPYEVRDQQVAANSAFRAEQDNMGLCVGPQVIVDDTKIAPMNGRWDIEPRKFWRNIAGGPAGRDGLVFVEIGSRVKELSAIFQQCKQLIEEVGTMPAWLQGQDAPAAMNSAMGASITWTAANLWVRRCIRNWDDDIVTPMISSFFDWNMQYSPKEEIKGDSKVVALGISALAELEGQAQRMQAFMQAAKQAGVPLSSQLMMLRQYARAFKLDPDLVCPTEDEIAKLKEAEAKQGPPLTPEQARLESTKLEVGVRQKEYDQRHEDNVVRVGIARAQIASEERISLEEADRRYALDIFKAKTQLQDSREQRAHDAQALNVESQLRVQTGAGV